MKLEFLKNILSVPTCSGHEEWFAKCIMDWCKICNIKCTKDGSGNLFLTKGQPSKGGFYPCCTSHIDTVHHDQAKLADEHGRLEVKFENGKLFCDGTGVGADCKTGVACCLQMLKQLNSCKCALYVKEEEGCVGCRAADNMSFFKDVSWCLGFDSPELNRAAQSCNGTPLLDDKFLDEVVKPICSKHGLTNFKHEPGTDIMFIRKLVIKKDENGKELHLNTLNIGSGGYNPHQKSEYAKFDEVCKAEATGLDLLGSIPSDKQWLSEIVERNTGWGWGGSSIDWSKYQTSYTPKKRSLTSWKTVGHGTVQDTLPGFDETPDYTDDYFGGSNFSKDDDIDGEPDFIDDGSDENPSSIFNDPDIKSFRDWLQKRKS